MMFDLMILTASVFLDPIDRTLAEVAMVLSCESTGLETATLFDTPSDIICSYPFKVLLYPLLIGPTDSVARGLCLFDSIFRLGEFSITNQQFIYIYYSFVTSNSFYFY